MNKILEEIIVRPEILDIPFDNKSLCKDKTSKVMVDIGFGNGEFPVHLAREQSDVMVFGIELSLFCIKKALKRVSRTGIHNIRLMQGDARFLLREFFPDSSVDKLFMNFPCPWPKKRHIKRRVTNPSFMDTVASVLKKGSIFEVLTDEYWYAEEIAKSMGQHPSLSVSEVILNPERDINTKYERKWLEEGKDIHLVRIRKDSDFSTVRILQGVEEIMHFKLPGVKISLTELKALNGMGGKDEQIHFIYREAYSDGNNAFLLETVSSDGEFEQKFYTKIVNQEKGAIIKIDDNSSPYRTPALKKALENLYTNFRLEHEG